MKRISVVLVAAVLCCSFPAGVSGQGFLRDLPLLGAWSGSPNRRADWSTAWPSITGEVKIGYRGIGTHVNLAIPPEQLLAPFLTPIGGILFFPQYGSLLDLFPLDLKLQDANLATGTVHLDAHVTDKLTVLASLSASIPRTVGIKVTEGPGIGVLTPQAWRFTGSGFQWWQSDVGVAYGLNTGVRLLAGVRVDVTTVRFSDPAPLPGYTEVFGPFTFPFTFPDFTGDLRSSLVIPYIGMQIIGNYFKGSLIVGGASASVRLPLRLLHPGVYRFGLILLRARSDVSEEALYTFAKVGPYVGLSLEGKASLTSNLSLNWWTEASWMSIRGSAGNLDLSGQSSRSVLGVVFQTDIFSASRSGDCSLSQSSFGAGGSVTFSF